MTIANSLNKDVFTSPFSLPHILSLYIYIYKYIYIYNHSRYINTLLDTLGTTDFTEIRDTFPFAEFFTAASSIAHGSRKVARYTECLERSYEKFNRANSIKFRNFCDSHTHDLSISDFSADSPQRQPETNTLPHSITNTLLFRDIVYNGGSARYLKILRFIIYWTPFLLLIVIVEQSVHIKYTKSTQRQKRLVSSRKISYKIFVLPSLFLLIFFLLLNSRPLGKRIFPLYLALRMRSSIRPFDEGRGMRTR